MLKAGSKVKTMRLISKMTHSATPVLRITRWTAMFSVVSLTLAGALTPLAAPAQVITGDLVGTVTDQSGAAVPQARVVVINLGTQARREITTGGNGEYAVSQLPIGDYVLRITAVGFRTFEQPNITLSAGDRLRADAALQVGTASETVEVTTQPAALQTDNSTVGSTVNQRATEDLPLNGRNFVNLVQVQAGVNAGPSNAISSGNRPDDRRASSAASTNGQQEILNNYILDGLDNNDRYAGLLAVRPSIDAIREIQINTNLYTAEVGRTAGAVINVLTKSGTNTVHGSAYEFFRNDITDAQNFFASGIRKPKLRQNQFGGSVGGPILKNHTFFFGDYEGFRQNDATSSVFINTVPTLFEHNNPGNFSDLKDPFTGAPGPVIAQPNPTSLAYFNLYPAPNRVGTVDPTTNIPSSNFIYNPARTQQQDTFDVRVDQNFSPNDTLFARYSFSNTNTFTPGELPPVNGVQPGGTAAGAVPGQGQQRAQNAQIDYTHILSSHLLLELRTGYTRLISSALPLNTGNNLNDGAFPIPGANRGLNDSGLAPIVVPGYAPLGDALFSPIFLRENTFQYSGVVTYSRGAHTFKTGAALIRRQATQFESGFPKGLFLFELAGDQVGDVGTFLSGTPFIYLRQNFLIFPQYRIWEPSVFVQDDWHASSKLRLNLGLRYDVFTAPTEKNGNLSNLDLTTSHLVTGDSGGVKSSYTNVAPRFGFSYTPARATVIRGGYGISFFPTDLQQALVLSNPPYTYASGTQVVFGSTLSAGIAPPSPSSTTNLTGQLSAKPFNYHTGYLEQFNLFTQRELNKTVITVGYVGELGRHLSQQIPNLNLPSPSGTANQNPAPYAATLPNVNTIAGFLDKGTSSYNSLQASVQHQYGGLNVNANYTLAHGLDDVTDGGAGTSDAYGLLPTQVKTYDYSNSDLDVRHRIAVTGSYELLIAKGRSGFAGVILGGWQLNSLAFWQTGNPFTVTDGNPQINLPTVTADRPNVSGDPRLSNKSLTEFFNVSDFVAQPIGTAGNSRRTSLYGPHVRRVDLSLFKTLEVYQEAKLQFRAECFNISNTPNFASPVSIISSTDSTGHATSAGQFGQIVQTNPGVAARQFQFSAKVLF